MSDDLLYQRALRAVNGGGGHQADREGCGTVVMICSGCVMATQAT